MRSMQRLLLEKFDKELAIEANKAKAKLLALRSAAGSIALSFIDQGCQVAIKKLQSALTSDSSKKIKNVTAEANRFVSIVETMVDDLKDLMDSVKENEDHKLHPIGRFFLSLVDEGAVQGEDQPAEEAELKRVRKIFLGNEDMDFLLRFINRKGEEDNLIEDLSKSTISDLIKLSEKVPENPSQSTAPGKPEADKNVEEHDDEEEDEDFIEGNCTEDEIADTIFNVLKVRKFRKGGKKLEKISKKLAIALVNADPQSPADIYVFFNGQKLKRDTKALLAREVEKCFIDGDPPNEQEVEAAATAIGGAEEAAPSSGGEGEPSGSTDAGLNPVSDSEDDEAWAEEVADLFTQKRNNDDALQAILRKFDKLGINRENLFLKIPEDPTEDIWQKLAQKLHDKDKDTAANDWRLQIIKLIKEKLGVVDESRNHRRGAVLVERWQRLAGIR